MLDYPSIAALAAVVREGSFGRAARVLNVTASAVSQRVKLLEERLGSVLVVRGQPCSATDAGRLLCRHVERVGMLEQDLQVALPKLASEADSAGRVTLRVAVNADSLGTWFIGAMAAFVNAEPALFDVVLDDEEHTAEWLRTSEVLAAITGSARAVQGCNSIALGRLRYTAVASPAFVRHYFATGINAASLAVAPRLTFNRKDRLQAQWMRLVCRRQLDTPTHWLPSTQAFIDASIAGIGWGMNPLSLVRPQLRAGTLVELVPERQLTVALYWQHTRLPVSMLDRLTHTVIAAARLALEA
jgi:LysR family transcriptional regulator, chromosome initiation inhibitor